jgi:hypothetical protein
LGIGYGAFSGAPCPPWSVGLLSDYVPGSLVMSASVGLKVSKRAGNGSKLAIQNKNRGGQRSDGLCLGGETVGNRLKCGQDGCEVGFNSAAGFLEHGYSFTVT